MRYAHILAGALALLTASCGGGGGGGIDPTAGDTPAGFTFSNFTDTTVLVQVTGPSGAVQGASVTLEDVGGLASTDVDATAGGEMYLSGLTDSNGQFEATARIPAAVEQVDIVVHAPGLQGTWTDTTLQASLGPFAPASRTTQSVAENMNLTVTLEAR